MVGEMPHPDPALRLVWASERIKTAETAAQVAALIREYRLPCESVPTQWLTEPTVWEALLEEIPMTALIRNLVPLTCIGLVTPGSEATRKVVAEVTNEGRLHKARVHPIQVLSALKTYAQGHGGAVGVAGRRLLPSWMPWTRRSTPRSVTSRRPASAGCWPWTYPARWRVVRSRVCLA